VAEDKGSKTEKPTAKRLQEARKKGQASKSMELNTFAVLMAGLMALFFAASSMYGRLDGMMRYLLSNVGQISVAQDADLFTFLAAQVELLALILAPVALAVFFAAILANLVQVGPMMSVEAIMPKGSKLNPIKGFSRLVSTRALMDLFKSVTKIIIVGVTAYLTVRGKMDRIVVLGDMSVLQIGQFSVAVAFEIFIKTCWVLAILALMDFAFQKWQFTQDLKMTKEEIKEEYKQTEGDPHVKARIRSTQKEMARRRMMSKVPEADVVVTNPTHLAVALLYDSKQADAPIIVAKGQALIAERIKEIAREHGVPVVENKPVAQALYKSGEVGDMIPFLLYQAVAEILAAVYRVKGKVIHAGTNG